MRRLLALPLDDAALEAAYLDLAGCRAAFRPYVVVNMVASVDGAIAVEGRTSALSTPTDRRLFHYLRSLADVILVGAQTVRAEGYGPPRLPEERQQERRARGQQPVPRLAVVSGSLRLDWSSRLFTDSPTRPFLVAPAGTDPGRLQEAERVADVILAGESRVDLRAALLALHGHGARLVLCEGGPTLNGELALGDLIDELCLTVSPNLVGGDVTTGVLAHVRLPGLLAMTLVHALEEVGELFLRYRRVDGASRPAEWHRPAVDEGASAEISDAAGTFHAVMADLDYPMLIVTASDGERRSGCLVGFAAQCSIDPPRFTVSISKKNHTYGVAQSAEALVVHLPSADQRHLAELFGTRTGDEVDKFAACSWHPGPLGAPVLDGVERWFAGRVVETVDSGDHVAFMLAPVAGEAGQRWPGQLGFQSVKDLEPGHGA
ncbi:MAG: pyrimidine reductase family protein [Acidimicrobiales bacterium]